MGRGDGVGWREIKSGRVYMSDMIDERDYMLGCIVYFSNGHA